MGPLCTLSDVLNRRWNMFSPRGQKTVDLGSMSYSVDLPKSPILGCVSDLVTKLCIRRPCLQRQALNCLLSWCKRLCGSINSGKSISWSYRTYSSCLSVNILNLRISVGISLTPIDAVPVCFRSKTGTAHISCITDCIIFSLSTAAALFLKIVFKKGLSEGINPWTVNGSSRQHFSILKVRMHMCATDGGEPPSNRLSCSTVGGGTAPSHRKLSIWHSDS